MIRVLVVEDEPYVAESLVALFEAAGMQADACATAEDALEAAPADVVLADLKLPGMSGIALLDRLRERDASLPVVLLTGHGTIGDAVAAMRKGAVDFLTKPVDPDVIVERIRKAAERARIERERDRLRSVDFVAESRNMRDVLAALENVAGEGGAVLLQGESGTGKELAAAYLHEQSPRRRGPLVRVNCAAIPAGLFEAELFGHTRGAFTGATRDRGGWFVEAEAGTLFLDEVGSLPLDGQAKLLRALESGEVRALGATAVRKVDVRVVAATNEDLKARVEDGSFRRDLYYRLAVFPVLIPPLRDREEDLDALATRFAAPSVLAPAAARALHRHRWPGNVRELRNVIERARIVSRGARIEPSDIELPEAKSEDLDLRRRTQAFERQLFREALRRSDGKKRAAAELLGIDPSNWAYHAKRLKLQ